MWTVAVAISASFRASREHRNDDGRNVAELNHGEHEKIALAAQETLPSGPWIGTTLIRAADRSVDQLQISGRSMLFKDLRVHKRCQNNPDSVRSLRLEHDLHVASVRRSAASHSRAWQVPVRMICIPTVARRSCR